MYEGTQAVCFKVKDPRDLLSKEKSPDESKLVLRRSNLGNPAAGL